jgi:DNA-directed RNA polymerase subunit omega
MDDNRTGSSLYSQSDPPTGGKRNPKVLPKNDNASLLLMNSHLVKAASNVVTNQQILVNMVSRRVRQLTLGHRPLVEFVPGLGFADIALSEIADGKLVFELLAAENPAAASEKVVAFPGTAGPAKKTKVFAA